MINEVNKYCKGRWIDGENMVVSSVKKWYFSCEAVGFVKMDTVTVSGRPTPMSSKLRRKWHCSKIGDSGAEEWVNAAGRRYCFYDGYVANGCIVSQMVESFIDNCSSLILICIGFNYREWITQGHFCLPFWEEGTSDPVGYIDKPCKSVRAQRHPPYVIQSFEGEWDNGTRQYINRNGPYNWLRLGSMNDCTHSFIHSFTHS